MAMKYLGDSFDLHAGGEDLMFPHHENEIAQSEAATHKPFARHWFHVRFLLVEGKKMSKSEGNFFTLRDLLLKGYRASAIRFLLLSVPYRHQLNFTFDGLIESTNAVDRLRTFNDRIRNGNWPDTPPPDESLTNLIRKGDLDFTAALNNDLNTAEARAAIFDVLRAVNTAADQSRLTRIDAEETLALLDKFDSIFAVLRRPRCRTHARCPRLGRGRRPHGETSLRKSSKPSAPAPLPTPTSTLSSPSAPRPSSSATSRAPTRSATSSSKKESCSKTPKKASAGSASKRAAERLLNSGHLGGPEPLTVLQLL